MDELQKLLQGMTPDQQANLMKMFSASGTGANLFGADPYGLSGLGGLGGYGGYNPFRTGAYAGLSAFGGMPPQASGFRYRNKMNEYGNQLNDYQTQQARISDDIRQMSQSGADAAKIAPLQKESADLAGKAEGVEQSMNELKSARNSYVGNAVAGAAPGVVSGVIGIIDKQRALNKLKGLNPEEFVPQEMRSAAAQAKLSAASAKTADDAYRRSQLQQAANNATQSAMLAATSPEQVQNAALRAQKVQNQGIQQLGAEGLAGQAQRKQYANQLGMQVGQARQNAQNQIQSQIDATKQAQMKDIYGTLGSIGMGFVTGGV